MRITMPLTGDTRVRRTFAFKPITANGEVRWLEFVKIHQSYNTRFPGWNNDWFE